MQNIYGDWFDLKEEHLGPWNIENETLVVRYCDCSFKCPICYAAGPSYLHHLARKREIISTKRVSEPRYLKYPHCVNWQHLPLNLLRIKKYVRVQGGEPLLNSIRSKLTTRIITDFLSQVKKNKIGKCVVVIQTNGSWLGLNEKNAINFLNWLIDFARNVGIEEDIKEGSRYRISIEISYKAPNPEDFSIFSGTKVSSLWKVQVNAYWNLINSLDSQFSEYNGIAIYPIAGFIMPINHDCGIIPVSVYEKPLFHADTWDENFEEIVRDFSGRVLSKSIVYKPYWNLESYWRHDYIQDGENLIKLRGEELEMTGFQSHVPSIYYRYREFKAHFDEFKKHFVLHCGEKFRRRRLLRIYGRFQSMGLREISSKEFNEFRRDIMTHFYGLESRIYYPNL